jgi:hypothetical protein
MVKMEILLGRCCSTCYVTQADLETARILVDHGDGGCQDKLTSDSPVILIDSCSIAITGSRDRFLPS